MRGQSETPQGYTISNFRIPAMASVSLENLVLTEEETEALHETWQLVAKDLKGNGVKFFLHFFQTFPEYQRKFKGFADVPLVQLAENKRLKAHAFTVLNAINGLIDNLDDLEVLNELLFKTGQNHIKRNLKISDFQNLKENLHEFLQLALGEAFTPTASVAWKKLLTTMQLLYRTTSYNFLIFSVITQ
ncbi:unnamed protein product [Allacma fusca]|uniref:Globin domain-containing protein n=1 Tax=Allacma fusca TaxID=39272 RepID=A0A8J2PZH9_9HEXA|nr:unnamed protein product [Allacma fusca]